MRADSKDRVAPLGRVALLALAGASLLAGVWAGLARLGLPIAAPRPELIAGHGPLVIGSALGTLIALERAVALGQRWAYAAPLASALAGAAALAGGEPSLSAVLLVIAGGVFVAASAAIVLRQAALFTLVMLAGAVAFAAGNLGWALGVSVDRLVLGWAAFLVLTIAGERLELSRLSSPPRGAAWSFGAIVAVLAAGSAITVIEPTLGQRLAGAALVALAFWLARYDLARRTLRTSGLPRYAAASVLAGYFWLAVSGATLLHAAPLSAGPLYDAALHALFLGFVFSMVFGHAPIILPAVLRIELPFHRALYAPLVLLHASVALRVAADWLGLPGLRGFGGMLNAASLLVFVLSVVGSKLRARCVAHGARTARAGLVRLLALLALAFGVVTVIEGGRTLYDPSVRAAAEPVVPFVLGFNFAAGFAYVAAAVGLWRARRWGAALAVLLAVSTLLCSALFGAHVAAGGAFASRTPVALAIRSAFWCIAAAASCRALGCLRRSVA